MVVQSLTDNIHLYLSNGILALYTITFLGGIYMIITTTGSVEGRTIASYEGIVFGEVISGINFLKDLGAGMRNFFGGRSQGYEDEILQARENALDEMTDRAMQMGADAVVGVKMDYETLGADNGMIMVTCSGTAVKLN